MKKKPLRSHCPINFGLEAFGDKWSLLILRDIVFRGKKTYGEFLKSEEGIATNILAARLVTALGPERALLTILGGAFVGAVFFLLVVAPVIWVRSMRRGVPFAFPDVPFGVFLAPAAMLALLWGDPLIAWYLERALP